MNGGAARDGACAPGRPALHDARGYIPAGCAARATAAPDSVTIRPDGKKSGCGCSPRSSGLCPISLFRGKLPVSGTRQVPNAAFGTAFSAYRQIEIAVSGNLSEQNRNRRRTDHGKSLQKGRLLWGFVAHCPPPFFLKTQRFIQCGWFQNRRVNEYLAKAASHRKGYGRFVKEFDIQFVDGDWPCLFAALGINQSSLEAWFESFETLSPEDAV